MRITSLKTRPFFYGIIFLLSSVVTGFHFPVLLKQILGEISIWSYSWIEYIQADAALASSLILLPEYHFVPLFLIAFFLLLMFIFQLDFPMPQEPLPLLLRIIQYSIIPVCLILSIIPLPLIISGYSKGYIPIPSDAVQNLEFYMLIALLSIMIGLCATLIYVISFAFYVYLDKNTVHTGLLFFPAVIILSYCSQWWGRFLFSIIIDEYRRKFETFIPIMSILVIIGQLCIIISILIFFMSLFTLIRRRGAASIEIDFNTRINTRIRANPSKILFFVTLIVFLPVSVFGWFIPYFLIVLTDNPLPDELNVVTCLCVLVGGILFYLWTKKVTTVPD